jgi:hypothetical protein
MLDGFMIIERGSNKVVLARQNPTLASSSTNKERVLTKIQSRPSIEVKKYKQSSVLTASQPKNQNLSNDYVNQNIAWAEKIVEYMSKVLTGSVPSPDAEFRVFTYVNDRLIVFTAINMLLFIVVGDSDTSELGCESYFNALLCSERDLQRPDRRLQNDMQENT